MHHGDSRRPFSRFYTKKYYIWHQWLLLDGTLTQKYAKSTRITEAPNRDKVHWNNTVFNQQLLCLKHKPRPAMQAPDLTGNWARLLLDKSSMPRSTSKLKCCWGCFWNCSVATHCCCGVGIVAAAWGGGIPFMMDTVAGATAPIDLLSWRWLCASFVLPPVPAGVWSPFGL